jgi:hypothetical protein
MKFCICIFALLISFTANGQKGDIVQLENHKGKTYEIVLPAQGCVKLKNGEKQHGLLRKISNTQIILQPMTDDRASIKEARKDKTLSESGKIELLYTAEKIFPKEEVGTIFLKKPRSTDKYISKIGLGIMGGLTVAIGIAGTIQDLENNRTPQIAIGAFFILALIAWLMYRSSVKKINLYKWKVKE